MKVYHEKSLDYDLGNYLITFGIPLKTVVDLSNEQLEELILGSPQPLVFGSGTLGDLLDPDVAVIGHPYDY